MNAHSPQAPPFWLRFLPAKLRTRIAHRPNLHKILANIGWLFGDRILRLVVGLVVGVWVARYLGPQEFGLLNYAIAFLAIFGAFASLGLDGVLVRDLVSEPERANSTIGTGFLMRVVSGFVALALAMLAISVVRPEDALTKAIVAIIGLGFLTRATEVVKFWFESHVQSKYSVWVENGVFLLVAAGKIILILNQAPLIAFAWAAFAEGAIVAVLLLAAYGRFGGNLASWRWDTLRAVRLLKESWPLILSGLAVVVYMRVDQIMLGQMLGDEAVGVYSVAVRLSEIWYFVPVAIVASVYPSLVKAKDAGEEEYSQKWQSLYDVAVLASLLVALPVSLLSQSIVEVLFGQAYAQAGAVFAVHVWTGVFVFLGVASAKWFIIEKRQMLSLHRTLLGAGLNVVLNLYAIPRYGVVGAAYATLFAQVTAAFLFDAIRRDTRNMFIAKAKSMNIIGAIGRMR